MLKTQKQVDVYNKIPQEDIFIDINSTLFFTGEYMYYSIYNFLYNQTELSSISKIAYVELINENHQSIFKNKIQLFKGKGQGDYFIPTNIPSGNYKLIGYTQWMLNSENNNLFNTDVSILNPYEADQKVILDKENQSNNQLIDSIIQVKTKIDMEIITDKEKYNKRSLVQLNFEAKNIEKYIGNYSLSVRKKNEFKTAPKPIMFNSRSTKKNNKTNKQIGDSIYLPELRGELVYGKIIDKKISNQPADISNKKISVSVVGKKDNLHILTTNENGEFIFDINRQYEGVNEFVFQVLVNNEDYILEINEFPEMPRREFDYYSFKINESAKDNIINRSVYNQVENSFYSAKPDTINIKNNINIPFYGSDFKTYVLDDYTRFPTVKETIIEVVTGVAVKKNKSGKFVFKVISHLDENNNIYPPLVMVDGVHVYNHEDILNYDPRNIERINFLSNSYCLGDNVYDGIISIETFDKNYLNNYSKVISSKEFLNRANPSKKYYKQQYSKLHSNSNTPDYRAQLLWEPKIEITDTLDFYTSDNVGEYHIELRGITDSGRVIHSEKTIVVK